MRVFGQYFRGFCLSSERAETTGTVGELFISLYSVWLLAVNNSILRERYSISQKPSRIYRDSSQQYSLGNHSESWELPYTALHF